MRITLMISVLLLLLLAGAASGANPMKVKEVREKHEAKLFELEGVSAVSHDEKTGEIVVYVEEETHGKKVPKKLDEVPVRVEVIGRIEALGSAAAIPSQAYTMETTYSRTGVNLPVFGGISLGSSAIPTSAGTLGMVILTSDGKPVILSNAHVIAMNDRAKFVKIGTPVWQPGGYDGGSSLNTVGKLLKYMPIVFKNYFAANYADAAIASVEVDNITGVVLNGSNTGFIRIVGTAGLSGSGWPIYKSGRSTGVTSGTIQNTAATVKVYYTSSTYAYFRDQILATSMSAPGDSGSVVWFDGGDGKHYWVGLLFAGSDTVTVICKAGRITQGLGVLPPQG